MAISRVTEWSAGAVLTAAALNAEFDNILDNALSLISPITGTLTLSGAGNIVTGGNSPQLTVGSGAAADETILFDGNAVDFYAAIDDSADTFIIGFGSSVGTNPAITVLGDGSEDVVLASVLAIGTTTVSTAQLIADQSSTSGAIPVLSLEQRDVDEPFIHFDTTIGTGNATEAVGGKSLTVTHFIMVNIEGVGDRYIQVGTIA